MRIQRNKRTGEYRADLDDSGNFVPVKVQRNKNTGEMRVLHEGQAYPYTPKSEQPTGFSEDELAGLTGYDAPEGMTLGEMGGKAIVNAPASLGGVLRDVGHAIMNPGETVKNLGSLLNGIESKAVNAIAGRKPGEELTGWQKFFGITDEDEANANAVGNYLADRYGGVENVKKTIATDPAGFAADAATLLTGGSGILRGAAKVGNLAGKAGAANALTKAANALGGSALYIDPVARTAQAAGSALRGAAKILPDLTPERLIESAYKFVPSTERTDRLRMRDTVLREQILPTNEGFEKLLNLRKDINATAQNLIDENAALQRAGKAPMIEPKDLAHNTIPYLEQQLGSSTRRGPLKRRAYNALKNFLDEYPDPIDTAQAQRMKVRAQAEGQKDFGKSVATPEQEVNKALAHELRTAIEQNIPEVAALNQRLGDLKVLAEPLERALGRTGNWELTSLTGNLGGIGGATLGGIPGAIAGAALGNISRSAIAKAKLAFMIDALRKGTRNFKNRPAIAGMLRGMRLLNTPMMRQALRSGAYTGGTMNTLQGIYNR